MKVYLKGSNRSKGGIKPYKAGWYSCEVLSNDNNFVTARLPDGNVIRKHASRFK